MDRRRVPSAERAPSAPQQVRRRKPPAEVRELVGTGRLCVVKGDFEIWAKDADKHAPGNTLRLDLSDLECVICYLADAVRQGQVQRWSFAALFEPTPEQRRWIAALERSARDASRPQPPMNAPPPALRKLPPAPVFFREHDQPEEPVVLSDAGQD